MKKIILSMAAMLFAGSMMAQTADEKAAAKAAKEAEKAAKKALNAAKDEALGWYNEGYKCYDQSNTKMNEFNMYKMQERNQDKVAAKQAELNSTMLELAKKGSPLLTKAFATGLIEEKKYFNGYRAQDFMLSQILNSELTKASQKEAFDTLSFAKIANELCDACHYQLMYGKKSDDQQKLIMAQVEAKFPRLHTYLAYAAQFEIENNNLEGACAAFDNYKNFAQKYPEVAKDANVVNPQVPYSQFAFNIYFIAYKQKNFDICDKYYEEALLFDDEQSKVFVTSSRPQIFLQKGDTVAWTNSLKEMIEKDPHSANAEVATQNLLAYYSQKGIAEMTTFAEEMLAKDPDNKIANYGMGYVFASQQKYEEALKYYQKCVKIDPDYMEGNFQCGFCYYQIGLENGRKIADKRYSSQAAADKDSEAKVKVYLRKAAPYFEKVRELKPDEPMRWAGELKVIYTNLGQKNKLADLPSDY